MMRMCEALNKIVTDSISANSLIKMIEILEMKYMF